jgi:argininosuccinate synthase
MTKPKKVALAYSGGLDTSVIIPWLKENYGCEVVAVCGDIGQGVDELSGLEEKARKTGASEVYVEDMREEFVSQYLWKLVRSGGVYEHKYLLGTSIARPLLAKKQVEVALQTGCDALAHGCTGKGNDQVRFELTYQALAPDLKIIVPWREWDLQGRADCVAYAQKHGIPVPVTREKPYSSDANLLHISFEGGILEDPWAEPPAEMFLLSKSPQEAPDQPRYLEIDFEAGDPVAVDGERLSPAALLARLNEIGGTHGVGRVDLVENRYVGLKSRGVYETPGGAILRAAHQAVESITLDREVMHLRDSLSPRYAELIYYGYWFAPERYALQKLIDEAQQPVSGTARLKLYKGNVMVVGRKSAKSLYRPDLVTFEAGGDFRQADAGGFIRLNALRLKIRAKLEGK